VKQRIPQAWLEWGFLALMVGLCATLSILQYRWTGDVSTAERARLRASLDQRLAQLGAAFHRQLNFACNGLHPTAAELEPNVRDAAFAARYRRWAAESPESMFSRVAAAIPSDGELTLYDFDIPSKSFKPVDWPAAWTPLAEAMRRRLAIAERPEPGARGGPPREQGGGPREGFRRRGGPRWMDAGPNIIEMPVFGPEGHEQGWIILEVNLDFLRTRWMPDLVRRHLNSGAEPDYDVEVSVREFRRREPEFRPSETPPAQSAAASGTEPARAETGAVLYTTLAAGNRIGQSADSTINVFSSVYLRMPSLQAAGMPPGMEIPGGPGGFGGRWAVAVRHRSGSLDMVVARARRRNLAVSFSLLCLILTAGFAIIRSTRQSRRLAEMQLNFVAGISHELRTPLTVIRGAGHNLLNGLVREPKQMQKYGALIVEHAELLTGIVEQVLAFTAIRNRTAPAVAKPVWLNKLIPEALEGASPEVKAARCTVDMTFPDGLPPVMGDPVALRRVLQNLISNAAKHGGSGGWIGVCVELKNHEARPSIEVRVSDRGPGIPEDELNQIFEPFYRGKNAIADHVRGTGLGLSLIREIVEAHKGAVHVRNRAESGAEFIVQLPAASAEQYDEFAHTDG
jgi:signal transduction histidine kinase